MNKIVKLLAASLASVALLGGVATAQSDQNCSITGPTGPNSVNICNNTENNTTTITCINDTDVLNINGQVASSGTAQVDNSTGVGTVQSGSAGNTNFVYNADTSISCAPVATASTGGQGGGSTTPPPATPPSTPAPAATALPETGSDSKIVVAAIATASFAGIAAAVRFGSRAFSKLV